MPLQPVVLIHGYSAQRLRSWSQWCLDGGIRRWIVNDMERNLEEMRHVVLHYREVAPHYRTRILLVAHDAAVARDLLGCNEGPSGDVEEKVHILPMTVPELIQQEATSMDSEPGIVKIQS